LLARASPTQQHSMASESRPSVPPPQQPPQQLRICMVCDFFFPRFGGVENHVWSMAQSLVQMGHKVVVVTHAYDATDGSDRHRAGVRWMAGGLKVYYSPLAAPLDQASLPTLFGFLPMLRDVLVRERIDIVHGHQATSQLTHEALFHARALGLRTVYTDHSVFGFGDLASIAVNKVRRNAFVFVVASE
jgi:phosphatidylinositol glycan class A protein